MVRPASSRYRDDNTQRVVAVTEVLDGTWPWISGAEPPGSSILRSRSPSSSAPRWWSVPSITWAIRSSPALLPKLGERFRKAVANFAAPTTSRWSNNNDEISGELRPDAPLPDQGQQTRTLPFPQPAWQRWMVQPAGLDRLRRTSTRLAVVVHRQRTVLLPTCTTWTSCPRSSIYTCFPAAADAGAHPGSNPPWRPRPGGRRSNDHMKAWARPNGTAIMSSGNSEPPRTPTRTNPSAAISTVRPSTATAPCTR